LLRALPSSTQKIMAKRSENCGASNDVCHLKLRDDIALVVADLGENDSDCRS